METCHGSRLVLVRTKDLVMPTVIHVVLNWPEAFEVKSMESQ